jgi:hypothetical protein
MKGYQKSGSIGHKGSFEGMCTNDFFPVREETEMRIWKHFKNQRQ